jgi:hypothetical protein
VQRSGPSHVQLKVALTSPVVLPSPLQVTLKWNGRRASIPVQNGEASFTDIPVHELNDSGGLQIQFVMEEPGSPVKDLDGLDR